MFFYLYEIRNNLNGKIYVGVHKTKDMNDGYMGSGKVINSAIEKYGIENFKKTILEEFNTSEEMFAREREIVNEEFLAREDVYNLRRGGSGGFDYINQLGLNHQFTTEDSRKGGETLFSQKRGWHSDLAKKNAKEVQRKEESGYFDPKVREKATLLAQTESARAKRKETLKKIGHQQGQKHSHYGKRWIYSTVEKTSKMVPKDLPLPDGWAEGRKIKF